MMNEPTKKPSELTLFELQTIVRRAQEILWLDGDTREWTSRQDWPVGVENTDRLVEIADLLAEFDLEPIEEDGEAPEIESEEPCENVCSKCGKHIGFGFPAFHLELCDECYEDSDPLEPEEGDLITEDHIHFNEVGSTSNPVFVYDESLPGITLREQLRAFMDIQNFWPNVWWLSDNGNYHLMSIEDK